MSDTTKIVRIAIEQTNKEFVDVAEEIGITVLTCPTTFDITSFKISPEAEEDVLQELVSGVTGSIWQIEEKMENNPDNLPEEAYHAILSLLEYYRAWMEKALCLEFNGVH